MAIKYNLVTMNCDYGNSMATNSINSNQVAIECSLIDLIVINSKKLLVMAINRRTRHCRCCKASSARQPQPPPQPSRCQSWPSLKEQSPSSSKELFHKLELQFLKETNLGPSPVGRMALIRIFQTQIIPGKKHNNRGAANIVENGP